MSYRLKAFAFSTTLLAIAYAGCTATNQPKASNEVAPLSSSHQLSPPEPVTPQPQTFNEDETEYKSVYDLFTRDESLVYKGFKLKKLTKDVRFEGIEQPMPVAYTLLTKGKKVIRKFYDNLGPLNATDFGLFPFVRGQGKQVIVAETAPRQGHFWIISLDPEFRILFDSADYTASREEPSIFDIDKDGTYELLIGSLDFYFNVKSYALLNTPQPSLIFKYDRHAGKYLIANRILQAYSLRGLDKEIQNLKPEVHSDPASNEGYFRSRIDILLRLIYADKQKEGWAFFDREYRLPDKQDVKTKIKAVLRKQGAYRSIYTRSAV